jgi:hypothetical protein
MKFSKPICLFLLVIFLSPPDVFAQRNLSCPKPGKQRKYYVPRLINYTQANGFVTYSFAYKYEGNFDKTYFKPVPGIGAAFNVQNYLVLSDRLELVAELMWATNQHGLQFKYKDDNISLSSKEYVLSSQCRLSVGIVASITPTFSVSLAPSLVYNAVAGYGSSEGTKGVGSGTTTANVRWDNESFPDQWFAGAMVHARWNAWKKLYLSFMSAIDLAASSPQKGTLSVYSNGIPEDRIVYKQPYLMHMGLGLGFRFAEIKRGDYE